MVDLPSLAGTPATPEVWAARSAEQRLLAAQDAARRFDAQSLWGLTHAYLNNYTTSGRVLPTQRRYRYAIEHFVRFAQQRGVDLCAPDAAVGDAYFEALTQGGGLSLSSVRVHLSANRALYRALRWANATALDPFIDVSTIKIPEVASYRRPSGQTGFVVMPPKGPNRYTAAQVQTLLEHASTRDRVLILLHVDAGLRIEQAVTLRWPEVDLQRWIFKNTKLSILTRQWQPLSPRLVLDLEALPRRRDGLVIGASQTAARQRLRTLTAKAGLPYWGWNGLKKE